MFFAASCFLVLAAFVVAILIGFSIGKQMAARHAKAACDETSSLDENTAWDEIRDTWTEWYSNCQEMDTPTQKAMLSWGRTLVLCASLCLVGIVLEVEYGTPISIDRILAGLLPSHSVVTISQPSQSHWHRSIQ
jgi:hypothetical protein